MSFLWEQGSKNPGQVGNYWPASETLFKWRLACGRIMAHIECYLGSFVIFRGSRTSIIKKPYKFVIFQRGGGVRTPSGSVHRCNVSFLFSI